MARAIVPSPAVQAKARELLARRSEWTVIRSQGMRRIVMPSTSTESVVYYVDPAGRACSCRAGRNGLVCHHRIAATEASHQDAMANPTTYRAQLKEREKILRLLGWEKSEYRDDPKWAKLSEWVERAERGGVR